MKPDGLQSRVPRAKRWLAAMLDWQGHSDTHIARTLRITEQTARRYLRGEYAPSRWSGPCRMTAPWPRPALHIACWQMPARDAQA